MGYYGYGSSGFAYVAIILIALVLGLGTQAYIKHTYKKWSRVPSSFGGTGADVAQRMLREGGALGVGIAPIAGSLTDNYNPRDNCLHLSEENYRGGSVASVAVACHEAGHAIQNATGYGMMRFRTALVPLVNFCSNTWILLLLIGVWLNSLRLYQLGVIMFAVAVLFQIVTLPVEIDASRRAVRYLENYGRGADITGAKQVLTAAALTYVAAALVSVLQLLYYAGVFSRNDR